MTYSGDGEVSAVLRPASAIETIVVDTTDARLVATGAITA